MSVTNADIKASGELAVTQKRGSSSASSLEKDTFKGHETQDHAHGITHRIDPAKHVATFETIGDPSFYTPIENYEGKHRYDPNFEWEPKEEKKLVRKVRTANQYPSANKTQPKMVLTRAAGSAHLLLGVPHVLCPATRSRQHLSGPIRQHAQRPAHEHGRL